MTVYHPSFFVRLALMAAVIVSMMPAVTGGQTAMIDACQYADDAAARAAWEPMKGSAPAAIATLQGRKVLRLTCNFAGTQIERASWDRQVKLDLVGCRGIQFQIYCTNVTPVAQFSLYFRSGDGWYATTFYPESASGWSTITIDKAKTRTEGKPAGWGQIRTIRLSAWRGENTDTELSVSDIRSTGEWGADARIAVLRGESAARDVPEETRSVEIYTESMSRALDDLGIRYAVISDLELTPEWLAKARLVILPHNPHMPDRVAGELVEFLNQGGKLLSFYGLPGKLRPVVKIDGGTHVKAPYPGYFSAIRFADQALPGASAVVGQRSWNITEAKPVPGASRVLGEWLDDKGKPTGYAAVVGSSNCIQMTHVLLPDDPVRKRQMLLAMVGHLVPEVWSQATEASIARIGQVGGYQSFDEAASQILKTAGREQRVRSAVDAARQLRQAAVALGSRGQYPAAMDQAEQAAQRTREAFCLAQRPMPGEFRAFWCHSAWGVEGMDWDEAIKRLADNGFTAILPNMLWGGVAYYDSQVLPVAPEVAEKGDPLAKCVAACKKYGVQIHVWKVNWNTGRAPAEFLETMRRAGRLQVNSKGQEEPWLCPSHPDNQKLEIDSMVEVARRYDVDGLHFDYIRYPDGDHCFCAGCRERFAKATGRTVARWPQDVLADGPLRQPWLDWRRQNINAVVQAVSEKARAVKPGIKISAAVFRNWTTDRDTVGQDWKLWCDRGWLDFVCPMDYTDSARQFENWVALQKTWAGKVPCYPGIGVSASSSQLAPDRVIAQIQIARRLNTKGFTIFNYGPAESRDLLPLLGLGITAKR